MNTKQMEYILELSRTKNFNRAAENLFISQPALTYQIKTVEEEIGFKIFERSGKGVALTAAGAQFTIVLEDVLEELREGIRHGQSVDGSFIRGISVGLPYRSALRYLPEAVDRFRAMSPDVSVTPYFSGAMSMQGYGKMDWDIIFSIKENARRMNGVKVYPLFESRIYCIMAKDDELADRKLIKEEDLKDRVLLTTNTRIPTVVHQHNRSIVQRFHNIIRLTVDANLLLHYVASHAGVALAPGIVNDSSEELAWIPFDTTETLSCVLLVKSGENRKSVLDFVALMQDIYEEHKTEPL